MPEGGELVPHKFNASKDLLEVGRRALFGFVVCMNRHMYCYLTLLINVEHLLFKNAPQCGAMTGACFGLVEVLRDPVLMSGKKMAATNKVLKFTYLFAG